MCSILGRASHSWAQIGLSFVQAPVAHAKALAAALLVDAFLQLLVLE